MKAGARSAETVLQLLCGLPVSYQHIMEDGAVYSRFDQSVCICPGEKGQQVKGVIFDLDDTLYPERGYVRSGFEAVGKWMAENEKVDAHEIADRLFAFFEAHEPAIDRLTEEMFSDSSELERVKAGALKVYREHKPVISLYDGASELIERLKEKGIKVGIITDGRPEGQRAKLEALGLTYAVDDFIITDELGGPQFHKPCDIAFRILQRKWGIPFEQMVYVGDNLTKDFLAPSQLGMQSVFVEHPEGVHYTDGGEPQNLTIRRIGSVTDVKKDTYSRQ